MKPLYRNLFFAFGLLAIGLLIWRFPDGWQVIRHNLDRVVRYLPLVVGSWIPVYALNAYAFQLLVNTGKDISACPTRLVWRRFEKL